jgi:hypothetical protein
VSEVGVSTVLHTYCAVPLAIELPSEAGIDGSPLSTVAVGRAAVVISQLSSERYGAEAWRDHSSDAAWLTRVVAQHHGVLQAALAETDVLPLRLPGIYRDLAALRRVLCEQEDALVQALSRIRGQIEMGAKVYLRAASGSRPGGPADESGRGYLTRRLSEAQEREEGRRRQQLVVADAHDALSREATRAIVNAPQDAALSGRREPMLLNAAYLIPRNAQQEFLTRSEDLQEGLSSEGLVLEITGPWPAYNFAELNLPKVPVP